MERRAAWKLAGPSGACLCFCFGSRGDSELIHQRHQVPIRPLFGDFAAFYPEDGGAGDCGLTVGWLHAKEWGLVSAAARPVQHDLVAFGDGVVDRKFEIGEAVPARLDVPPDVVRPGCERGEHRVMVVASACDEFANCVQLSLTPTLVHEPFLDLLVIFGLSVISTHG